MKSDKINMCACMGPMHGDPYCICEMKQRGLAPSKSYEWTQEQKDKLNDMFTDMFKWKTTKTAPLKS